MRKLIESTHVSLGGEIGSPRWAFPYPDEEHHRCANGLLAEADALPPGRPTYEGLSAADPQMDGGDSRALRAFIDRTNGIATNVVSTTLRHATWDATVIDGDVPSFVADLNRLPGGNIIKYGEGPLDASLMEHGLIHEFHLLKTPAAVGRGQHMCEAVDPGPALELAGVTRFASGVGLLVYTPVRRDGGPLRQVGGTGSAGRCRGPRVQRRGGARTDPARTGRSAATVHHAEHRRARRLPGGSPGRR